MTERVRSRPLPARLDAGEHDFLVRNVSTAGANSPECRVIVATTSRDRRTGLRSVTKLAPDTGLWIAPCEAIHTFGMKIVIDAVFLDRRGKVRKICQSLRPNRMAICFSAHSVMEFSAGFISRFAIRPGDELQMIEVSAAARSQHE